MDNLFSKNNYKLIHISGYCNLFYLKKDLAGKYLTPDPKTEIPKNDNEVNTFTKNFGMEGFYPSWLGQKSLSLKDYDDFVEPKA